MSSIRHKINYQSYTRHKITLEAPDLRRAGANSFINLRSDLMPHTTTKQLSREQQVAALENDWATNPRWKGLKRGYSAADVVRLRGSFPIEHTLARRGAEKLWHLLHDEPYIYCLGALTGGQAMQQVKAGMKAIYLSGWQVAADNNGYAAMYPDQSLYPVDSVPTVVQQINNSFLRADEIQHSKGIDAGDKG